MQYTEGVKVEIQLSKTEKTPFFVGNGRLKTMDEIRFGTNAKNGFAAIMNIIGNVTSNVAQTILPMPTVSEEKQKGIDI